MEVCHVFFVGRIHFLDFVLKKIVYNLVLMKEIVANSISFDAFQKAWQTMLNAMKL